MNIEIRLSPWDIYGMYQPDTIKRMTVAGQDYLLFASEGSSKEYEFNSLEWTEEYRGEDFVTSEYWSWWL